MKWFEKLKAHYQLILIIIAMAFVIALIDVRLEIRQGFMTIVVKTVEAICNTLQWQNMG
ncbi:MAG: hypothetical protein ACK5N8_02345 [Alphaproteobacteria bacterium]